MLVIIVLLLLLFFYPSTLCVSFQWGDKDGETLCQLMKDAYEIVVHWRQNSFLILSGKAGKDFVLEWLDFMSIILSFIPLLLQCIVCFRCCCFRSLMPKKSKEYVACLGRRLVLWHNADISALLKRKGVFRTIIIQSTIQSESKPKKYCSNL